MILSVKIDQTSRDFLNACKGFKVFQDFLSDMVDWSGRFDILFKNSVSSIIQGKSSIQGELSGFINNVISVIRSRSQKNIFLEIDSFKRDLLKINDVDFSDLIEDLSVFEDKYDQYIRSYSKSDTIEIMHAAVKISSLIEGYKKTFQIFLGCTHPVESDSELKEFSVIFEGVFSMKEIGVKITAFYELYSAIANLIELESKEISSYKIESGSLWIKIFGDIKVIEFILSFMRDAAAYIHRNYTREGKIAELPTHFAALDQAIHMSEKLKAHGIDTTDFDARITVASVSVANNMNKLLGGTEHMVINGESLEGSKKQVLSLPKPSIMAIEDHTTDQTDNSQ